MKTFEFPFPPPELSPNKREKWERIKQTAAYREECIVLARQVKNLAPKGTYPLTGMVKATITFLLKDRRRRDFLNLYASFKAGEDALVHAGVILDDSVWCYQPVLRAESGEWGVRVELEEA